MSEVVLTKENFDKEVGDYEGVVLVDFWAPWCGPCRALGPVMAEIAESGGAETGGSETGGAKIGGAETDLREADLRGAAGAGEKTWGGGLKVGKVNVDLEGELAERFNVMSIPTVKIFNGGKEVGMFVGFMPKEDILNYLKKVVL